MGEVHGKSTPHNPQANGLAESGVKAMNNLLRKTTKNGHVDSEDFRRGLFQFCNTPKAHRKSPAEILFGRPLSTFTIAHWRPFNSEWLKTPNEMDSKRKITPENQTVGFCWYCVCCGKEERLLYKNAQWESPLEEPKIPTALKTLSRCCHRIQSNKCP
eukprot:maker-scaffold203_size261420-snap-gene-1.23 protein:Tk10418 transcript:maker-scaffold203_size261420-snap-gene-1.23-mRNA-1 annotation:"poly protein"